MAGKKQIPDNTPGPDAGSWTPGRPMGLARALQKAGYGTRRRTAEIIAEGRVQVDGRQVTDPTFMVEPGCTILLDNSPLTAVEPAYFAFHKPVRVVCTATEGPERRLVSDFFPTDVPGLTTAGRMDGKSTGLLLVSNDSRWNNAVAGSDSLEQEYRIQIEGELTEPETSVISAGIHMPNLGLFRPVSVKIVEKLNGRTVILMVTKGTRARMVRRMFSTLRHKITLLRRTRVGEIRLGSLPPGGLRRLNDSEIRSIAIAGPVESGQE